MSGEVGKVVRPQLRGLLQKSIKRNILVAGTMAAVAAILQKVFINDERKNAYAEFYKTYDIEKAFHQMRNKGVFDSCEPDN